MTKYRLPTERHLKRIEEGDKFNTELLAKQLLATVLMEMKPPNCFGLYGNWGSGKSTLIHFMLDLIEKDKEKKYEKLATVYFEPWKYEYSNESDLLFALLRKIETTLELPSKNWKRYARDLLTIGSWASKELLNVDTNQISEDMKKWEEALQSEYESWIDSVESFSDEFETVINEGLKKKDKELLIVFIDDLDRCLPDNAIRLLEAIKNFLNVDNTIFVIAVDRRVVSAMIEKKYGLHDGYGDEYLMKIIHYSYDIPNPTVSDLVSELLLSYEMHIEDIEKQYIADFLSRFAPEPRRVKHYVHQFGMRYIFGGSDLKAFAADKHKQSGMQHASKRMDLFVVTFLMARFPKIFAFENAESWLKAVYERVMSPQTQRATDNDVEDLLTPKEIGKLRLIFNFGFTNRHKDAHRMEMNQLLDAYKALQTMKA